MEGLKLGASSRLLTGSVTAILWRRFDPVTFRSGKYEPMGAHLVSKTGTSAARSAGVRILYFPRNGVSNGCCTRPVKPRPSAWWVRVPRRQRSDFGPHTYYLVRWSRPEVASPPSSVDRASGSGPEGAWFESTGGRCSAVQRIEALEGSHQSYRRTQAGLE